MEKNIRKNLVFLFILSFIINVVNLFGQGVNIIKNPSFEDGWNNWSHSSNPSGSGIETIATPGYSGDKCLKMQPGASTDLEVTYQNINSGVIISGKYYSFSVWYKTPVNQINQSTWIILYDLNWKTTGGGTTYKAIMELVREGASNWQKIDLKIKIPVVDDFGDSTNGHNYRLCFYVHKPLIEKEPVYYDDVNLISIDGDPYSITPCGPSNGEHSKTIDLGSDDEIVVGDTIKSSQSGIVAYPLANLSDTSSDEDINFRMLKSKKTLYLKIPAFDVDEQGFPSSPMLLEIRYKDFNNVKTNHAPADWTPWALIESYIKYQNDDTLSSKRLWDYYIAGGLGDKGDEQWKYYQIVIQKTQLQLIRAINGKFIIKIIMPTGWSGYDNLMLPIDYISLCSITEEEANAIILKQREQRGFWKFSMPQDEPETPVIYPDAQLTIFTRDIMRSINSHTKPQLDEVDDTVFSFSALGETEVLNFGMYSEEGIEGLSFQVSDLTNTTGLIIPKTNITIYQVVEDETKLPTPNYATMPDRLEEIDSLSILPETSMRIWIKVHVPADICGGLYEGNVEIRQGGGTIKSVGLRLNILPIKLEKSANINPIEGDPFVKIISSNQSEVFKLYSEVGLDPMINTDGINSTVDLETGNIIDFRMETFNAQVNEIIDKGFFKDRAVIVLGGLVNNIYYRLNNKWGRGDSNLYANLNDPRFKKAFMQVIDKINTDLAVNNNKTLIYLWGEEPGGDPYQRITLDRLYTYLHEDTTAGYKTMVDNWVSGSFDSTTTGRGIYIVNGDKNGVVPALKNDDRDLVDYKLASIGLQKEVYDKFPGSHGYYTTGVAQKRNPAYNRFLNGLFAYRTNAKAVLVYAMNDFIGDPYDDFDALYNSITLSYASDYLLAYPTWSGKLLPTLGMEGLREGIKDAKYFATLEQLIEEHPGTVATEAQNYLNTFKSDTSRISPYYYNSYSNKNNAYGHYNTILGSVSEIGDENDYEVFTKIRNNIISYIENLIPIAATINVTNDTICSGSSTVLIAGDGGSYTWSNGNTTDTITVYPTNITTYTVTISNTGGCITGNVTVTVNPLPSADAGLNDTVCNSESAYLIATGGNFYEWNTGATTDFINIIATNTSAYTVTVTDINGCSDADEVNIIVNDLPTAIVTTKDDTVCFGSNTDLFASGGVIYEWTEGQTNDTITVAPSVTTTYTVTVTDANGCADVEEITFFVDNCNDIITLTNQLDIAVFPNPSKEGIFSLSIKGTKTTIDLYLLDIMGQLIYNEKLTVDNSDNYIKQFDFSTYPKGTYFLKLIYVCQTSNADNIYMKKIVID